MHGRSQRAGTHVRLWPVHADTWHISIFCATPSKGLGPVHGLLETGCTAGSEQRANQLRLYLQLLPMAHITSWAPLLQPPAPPSPKRGMGREKPSLGGGFLPSHDEDLREPLVRRNGRGPHLEGSQEAQASSPFRTPTAGSLQSWDRRVRPRLV